MTQLAEQTIRHQVFLEGVKTGEANTYAAYLRRIDRALRLRLSDDMTDISRTRLERLIRAIDKDLSGIFQEFQDEIEISLGDIAEYEADFEARSVNKVLDGLELDVPAVEQVRSAIFTNPLSVRGADGGKLLSSFIKDWTKTDVKRFTGAIRQGYFEGQTNAQIIKTIRGTRANKFKDGLLAISSRNAEAIVRTSVQHTASMARQAVWAKNRDVIKGVRWVSVLDNRTSHMCRSLDGQKFKIDKGPRPPIHIRCRSTVVADVKSEFSLVKKAKFKRSSQEGPVDANLTYYSWLKRQPKGFQEQVLGKSRAKLFRDGGLTSERFAELNVGKRFEPLTLEEMRRLEPLAFEKADI